MKGGFMVVRFIWFMYGIEGGRCGLLLSFVGVGRNGVVEL